MSGSDRRLERIMAELSCQQRIRAWVEAMRRAGGLNFAQADDGIKDELLELEQSTPKGDRPNFLRHRDRILGLNGLVSQVFGACRLQTEALLARTVALLSLTIVVNAKDTRKLLRQALEDPTGQSPRTRKRRKAREALGLPSDKLAQELAAYSGAMFAYDRSALHHYWAEVLAAGPASDTSLEPVDLALLLETSGEPIDRTIGAHVRALVFRAREAASIYEALAMGLFDKQFEASEVTIPPVDAQLARSAALAEMLKRSPLAEGSAVDESEQSDVSRFRKAVEEPRRFLITVEMINSYEKWLYPSRDQVWPNARDGLEWHPWMDFHLGGANED